MLNSEFFVKKLNSLGFSFATGVPCSLLKAFLESLNHEPLFEHIRAANEGDALSIASGAALGGRKSFVYLQNSGLGNLMNPLTSLTLLYRIPVLLLLTWRGNPNEDKPDAPEHILMGQKTLSFLELFDIPYKIIEDNDGAAAATLEEMSAKMASQKTTVAIVIPEGRFSKASFVSEKSHGITRLAALKTILENSSAEDIFVATTGYTARDLAASSRGLGQSDKRDFSMMGSMGCAAPFALGIAQSARQRVVVLDGDGALLMRMGALSTIGAARPKNFLHIVFDNQSYESTGLQRTTSANTNFAEIALACGYQNSVTVSNLDELELAFKKASELSMIVCKTAASTAPPSPRVDLSPEEIAQNVSAAIAHGIV